MKPIFLCGILVLQAACTSLPNSPNTISQLRLIAYQNAQGEAILPVARSAGDARTQAWQRWLHTHYGAWQSASGQALTGKTQWCAQWQENEKTQRLCRRGDTLVHFEYGMLHDANAVQSAQKIWIGNVTP